MIIYYIPGITVISLTALTNIALYKLCNVETAIISTLSMRRVRHRVNYLPKP